ncbi:MAG: transaldolase [Thermoleophilia bacterium]|nr:transaldolase [Thermoleophilia bacterium]
MESGKKSPLLELEGVGQSVWIDYLSRDLMQSDRLRRLVEEDGLKGVTSNPTIFQKAISGSELYDESLRRMVNSGINDPKELFLGLAFEDIGAAAGMFLPVHRDTGGREGYISIETSPNLAYDISATLEEVRRLFSTLGRPNILVKVPATEPGVEAIRQLTGEGININVTLLFSVSRYLQVADAYMRGLEERMTRGEPIDGIMSVASFFVSRVDTLVDKRLEDLMARAVSEDARKEMGALRGRAAVANSRLAYQEYKKICGSERFRRIEEAGGKRQRLLWGSSSTKNPAYSDVKYVEELIAPETINTMTEDTIEAFRDHGAVRVSIEDDLAGARELFESLAELGIDAGRVGLQLEEEGVTAFTDSFLRLLKEVAGRRDRILEEAA